MMEITEGSHAVAEAVRLCRPQVVSAYPITPQTHIVEALADFVANGQLDAEYITVENELSALSACVGASAAGSRTYSATTSQGLLLMFEVVFNAAGMRLPIVMSIANRAVGAPLSIWNDMQDSISLRDSGWLQFYAEDNQEATDLHFLAYKVAEDPAIQLPAFVCFDGFILSHTYEPIDMLSQEQVDKYLPKYQSCRQTGCKRPHQFRHVCNTGLLHRIPVRDGPGPETGKRRDRKIRQRVRHDVWQGLQRPGGRLPAR